MKIRLLILSFLITFLFMLLVLIFVDKKNFIEANLLSFNDQQYIVLNKNKSLQGNEINIHLYDKDYVVLIKEIIYYEDSQLIVPKSLIKTSEIYLNISILLNKEPLIVHLFKNLLM